MITEAMTRPKSRITIGGAVYDITTDSQELQKAIWWRTIDKVDYTPIGVDEHGTLPNWHKAQAIIDNTPRDLHIDLRQITSVLDLT